MANLVDLSFAYRYTSGNMEYKLVMIPAYHSVLPASIEEIEFPPDTFLRVGDISGGFKAGMFIGCPEAMELVCDVQANNFYGSFTDSDSTSHTWLSVAQVIINRGYSSLTSDPTETAFNYYTNRWTRYKKKSTEADSAFEVDFIGFQVPGGDTRSRELNFGDSEAKEVFELRCQDYYRTVLADCNLDATLLTQFEPTYTATIENSPVLAANRIPFFDYHYLFHLLDEPGLNLGTLNPDDPDDPLTLNSAFVKESYELVSYDDIFKFLGYRIYYVMNKKLRKSVDATALLRYLTGGFYETETFYKATTTKDDTITVGAALTDSDFYYLLNRNIWDDDATVSSPSYSSVWNLFSDGFMNSDNIFDLLHAWCEATGCKVLSYKYVLDETRPFYIAKCDEAVSSSDVADAVALLPYMFADTLLASELLDNVSSAIYHYKDMQNVISDSFQVLSPASLNSQPSFELNALVDNCFPGAINNGDDTVEHDMNYGLLSSIYFSFDFGAYFKSNSKFSNIFYLDEAPYGAGSSTTPVQIAVNPVNKINSNSVDYGDVTGYPLVGSFYPAFWQFTSAWVNNYYVKWQNSIQLHDAYPEWLLAQINSLFGSSANLFTIKAKISGEFFSPQDIISPSYITKLDYSTDFSSSGLDYGDPIYGFITAINSYDIENDTYDVDIVLSNGIS